MIAIVGSCVRFCLLIRYKAVAPDDHSHNDTVSFHRYKLVKQLIVALHACIAQISIATWPSTHCHHDHMFMYHSAARYPVSLCAWSSLFIQETSTKTRETLARTKRREQRT